MPAHRTWHAEIYTNKYTGYVHIPYLYLFNGTLNHCHHPRHDHPNLSCDLSFSSNWLIQRNGSNQDILIKNRAEISANNYQICVYARFMPLQQLYRHLCPLVIQTTPLFWQQSRCTVVDVLWLCNDAALRKQMLYRPKDTFVDTVNSILVMILYLSSFHLCQV